jgi:single-stranded DNA-binding protein
MNQNHVSVIGRLTADPRIVTVKSGQICNLNVAVNGRPKKEGGVNGRSNTSP